MGSFSRLVEKLVLLESAVQDWTGDTKVYAWCTLVVWLLYVKEIENYRFRNWVMQHDREKQMEANPLPINTIRLLWSYNTCFGPNGGKSVDSNEF